MKKQLLLPALLTATLSATFVSCKKDKTERRSDLLTGTWTQKESGTDENGNGQLDAVENNFGAGGEKSAITFRQDGSAIIESEYNGQKSTDDGFYWRLVDLDQNLELSYKKDKDTIFVYSLTKESLILQEIGSKPLNIAVFTK